jgi:hypothetical protein
MVLEELFIQVLVVDNITLIVVTIRFMYLNAAVLMGGKIYTFVAIRE